MHASAVTLTAVACLAGSVLTGIAVRGRAPFRALLRLTTPLLRGLAMTAILAIGATLVLAAIGMRGASGDIGPRVAAFSDSAAALDRALRGAGPAGEPARMELFRLVERLSRELSATPSLGGPFDTDSAATLHDALHRAVDTLTAQAGPAGARAAHAMAELADAFAALEAGLGRGGSSRWLAAAALAWLLLGVGLIGVLAGPQQAGAIGVILLAGVVATAIFMAEDLAAPPGGPVLARMPLTAALFTIAE